MANPSGRAGRTWENRVIDFLADVYPKAERRRLRGRFDRGDIVNTGPWAFECKNEKVIRWSDALSQAEKQAAHAGVPWHAAIINRRGHVRHKAYVLMTLGQFRELLRTIEELRDGTDIPD